MKALFTALLLSTLTFTARAGWDEFLDPVQAEDIQKENDKEGKKEDNSRVKKLVIERFDKVSEKVTKALDAFEKMTISVSVGESIDFLEAFKLSIKYKYRAEPADIGKYFSRTDRWRLNTPVRIGDFFDNVKDSILGFDMDPGVEVTFVQLFDDVHDARKIKNGYTPWHLPINADAALNRLNPGDLAIFEGNMTLLLGISDVATFLKNKIDLTGYVGGSLSGKFKVFVFRGHDKLIRLRIAAIRSNGVNYKVRLGIENAFDPMTKIIRRPLVKMLDADEILSFTGSPINNQDLYMGDFTLNLEHPEVLDAYNNLFSRPRMLRTVIQTFDPTVSDNRLQNKVASNLTELTEIARLDYEKDDKRVEVNFRGANNANGKNRGWALNLLKLFNHTDTTYRRDNRLTDILTLPDGDFHMNYFFPSWTNNERTSALFSWFKKERDDQAVNIIYETAEPSEDGTPGEITKFHSIGFYRDISDNTHRKDEHKEFIRNLVKILPHDVFAQLKDYLSQNNWFDIKKSKENVRISTRYFLHEEGLRRIENTSREAIEEKIVQIIKRADAANPYSDRAINDPKSPKCKKELLQKYGITNFVKPGGKMLDHCNDISKVASIMSNALSRNYSNGMRHLELVRLESSALFRYLGPAILLSLLPREGDPTMSYFELVIAARELTNPLVFKYGNLKDRALYEKIIEIDRLLNEQLPDLRLNSDKESKTEKTVDP